MLFRQLFDAQSSTYSYLLASGRGREAVLIDPVLEQAGAYLQLIGELDLRLVRAIDTHTHADHVTALGELRRATGCVTVMGQYTQAECVSEQVRDGEVLRADGIELQALYTPGHTNESFSFVMKDRVFTGDVLLIRGTGRTDFQGGDPHQSWASIQTLLRLPGETLVCPAHDYKGWTISTIGEERAHNPRIAGKTEAEYVDIMNKLDLPDPKLMDIAVRANLACGDIS